MSVWSQHTGYGAACRALWYDMRGLEKPESFCARRLQHTVIVKESPFTTDTVDFPPLCKTSSDTVINKSKAKKLRYSQGKRALLLAYFQQSTHG